MESSSGATVARNLVVRLPTIDSGVTCLVAFNGDDKSLGVFRGIIHGRRFGQAAHKRLQAFPLERWAVFAGAHRVRCGTRRTRDSGQIVPGTVVGNQIALPQIKGAPRAFSLDRIVPPADITARHADSVAKLPSFDFALVMHAKDTKAEKNVRRMEAVI